jgi:WS/DGAT/MGAT family acyltransferase
MTADSPPRATRAESGERLSPVDLAWWRMDHPTNLMVIHALMLFDQHLELEELRAVVRQRLLPIPRFRQRVAAAREGGGPLWLEDSAFDLGHHVTCRRLPLPGGEVALRQVVGGLMNRPLDPARPLWELILFEGLHGGCAVLARLHHCMADGLALMLVLLALTDPEEPASAGQSARSEGGGAARLLREAGSGLRVPAALAEGLLPEWVRLMTVRTVPAGRRPSRGRQLLRGLTALGRLVVRRPDPGSLFKGPLGREKRVAYSEPVPLVEVRALKEIFGGTVNDLLTSVLCGGLGRYLRERGERVSSRELRAAVPVSLRPLERMGELGNQFGLVFLSLPIGVRAGAPRLAAMRQRMAALKGSAEAVVVLRILDLAGRMPLAIQRQLVRIFGSKATAVLTSVPGPIRELRLAGHPIRDLLFWVPQAGHLGLGLSLCSYAGRVRLGVACDAGLVAEPAAVVAAFEAELAELRWQAQLRLRAEGAAVAEGAAPPLAEVSAALPPRRSLAPRGGAPSLRRAAELRRFAFVIHPLDLDHIRGAPRFRWSRHVPSGLLERMAARLPPRRLSRIVGARSVASGAVVEGLLYALCATPRQMLARPPEATYAQLLAVAGRAQAQGARILGLGAYTSMVGDAGVTIARRAGIAVTSGNSLTVAATLETAREALRRMGGPELGRCRAMVVGATGSIGAACARRLARGGAEVVLVGRDPARLHALEALIARETPGVPVIATTEGSEWLALCDLVITATSSLGGGVLDLASSRPGTVVCDIARPPDVTAAQAARRADLLVVEAGELVLPGEVDFGFDIGLPPGVAYGCLSETALLAMAGRFESFSLGRRIEPDRVEEIWELAQLHGFRTAPLVAFGRVLEEEEIALRRALAESLLSPERLRILPAPRVGPAATGPEVVRAG